ncbi:hypothetical protein MMC22_002319 [Lobaria immixta]|nr:hypothetical protein [Lobaria immixta]
MRKKNANRFPRQKNLLGKTISHCYDLRTIHKYCAPIKGFRTTEMLLELFARNEKGSKENSLLPWQVNAILDVTVNRSDTVVSAGTDAGKSLLYQAVPLVIPDAIVLVITPTIALMEDQQRSLAARGINAVALTAAAVKEDYTLRKRIDNGEFSIVLASPEILLATGSHFLTVTIAGKTSNAFCKRLACIAVDEAHLIWGWREFRQEYRNIGLLTSFFAKIPFLILSATMTNNVLGYIRKSLHLRAPIPLYERTLDRPNITYFVAEIRKLGYINETLIAEWREFDTLRAHLGSRKTRFLGFMSSRMLEPLRAGDSLVEACSKDSNRYENAIV